jgi:hypothetical protein
MSDIQKERMLTPAAKETFENILREYAERILEEALMRAHPLPNGEKEISVRDILESIDVINQGRRRSKAKQLDAILTMYSFLGILIALCSMAFLFYKNLKFELDFKQQIILFSGVIGLLMAIFPYFYRKLRRVIVDSSTSVNDKTIDSSFMFIKKWQDIENTLRSLTRKIEVSNEREPVSSTIQLLYSNKILTESDVDTLRFLLKLRNELVHEDRRVERDQVLTALEKAEDLQNRLSRQFPRQRVNQ